MKTLIVLAVIALFVLTIRYYLIEEKKKECESSDCSSDDRIENIKRAKKKSASYKETSMSIETVEVGSVRKIKII